MIVSAFETHEDAEAMARLLVDGGLVAAAQITKIRSVYRWDGAHVERDEHQLVCSTTDDRWVEVEETIRSGHPYEVCQIVGLPATAVSPPFASWITAAVSRGQ